MARSRNSELRVPALTAALERPARFDAVSWHAHEFLFGYLSAVISGFLLTVVPNWTGQLPFVGWSLGELFAFWVGGRGGQGNACDLSHTSDGSPRGDRRRPLARSGATSPHARSPRLDGGLRCLRPSLGPRDPSGAEGDQSGVASRAMSGAATSARSMPKGSASGRAGRYCRSEPRQS